MKSYLKWSFVFGLFLPAMAFAGFAYTHTLRPGESSADVKALQQTLNQSADTQVSAFGAGSPGSETNYFGSLTKSAVIKFQNKYGLAPDGIVGPKTAGKLSEIFGGSSVAASSYTGASVNSYSNQYTSDSFGTNTISPATTDTNSNYLSITSIGANNVVRGGTIDVYGTGFSRTSKVYLGMDEQVSFDYLDSGHIKIKVPSNFDLTVPWINIRNPLGDTRWTQAFFSVVSGSPVTNSSGPDVKNALDEVNKTNRESASYAVALQKELNHPSLAMSLKELLTPFKKAHAVATNNFFGGSIDSTTYCTCYYDYGIILDIKDVVSNSTYTTVYKTGPSTLHSNYNVFTSGPNVIGGTISTEFECKDTVGYFCDSSGDSADSMIDAMRGVGTSSF